MGVEVLRTGAVFVNGAVFVLVDVDFVVGAFVGAFAAAFVVVDAAFAGVGFFAAVVEPVFMALPAGLTVS